MTQNSAYSPGGSPNAQPFDVEGARAKAQELAEALVTEIPFCPWTPNPGPQTVFLLDFGRETLYGGAAGGGKSIALMMAASMFLHVPGYAALLLRKSYADLGKPGALMDIGEQWWAGQKGTRFDTQENTWYFDCAGGGKSRIVFGYLDKALDHLKYQGGAYQFCMTGDTPIFMADRTWKPLSLVSVGDLVSTLQGPRAVTRTHALGTKPVTRITTRNGHSVVVGDGHRILSCGSQLAPTPTLCREASGLSASLVRTIRGLSRRLGCSLSDQQPTPSTPAHTLRGSWLQVNAVSSADDPSSAAESCDGPPTTLRPQPWSVQAVLHEPALRSSVSDSAGAYPLHEFSHEQSGSPALPDSSTYCQSVHGSGDELSLPVRVSGPGDTRLQDGAEAGRPTLSDDPIHTPSRSPQDLCSYFHPYTMQSRECSGVSSSGIRMDPAGEADVFDLTVDGESHYIAWGGIISSNCGYDELTQHREKDYRYLFSRMRKVSDPDNPLSRVPIRMRATANPGGPGHCVPSGDVLTPAGWRPIETFAPGDPVFTVNAAGELVETVVAQVHASHYEGDLIDVSGRGLRILATPNHSVAKLGGVRGERDGAKFSLVPLENLPGQATILRSVKWAGTPHPGIALNFSWLRRRTPGRPLAPLTLSGNDYAELLGWFLSEGHTVARDHAFGVSQTKVVTREKLRVLLERLGFSVSWSEAGALVYSHEWFNHFVQFGKCRDKFIPATMKAAPPETLSILLTALMDGDGHWCEGGASGTYYTTSAQLAADVAEIALKCSWIVSTHDRQRDNRDGLGYAVNMKRTKSGGTELLTGNHVYAVDTATRRQSDIKRQHFNGMVYCLGIEGTHTFVIRQSGSVWVSGNSWVYKRFIGPWQAWKDKGAERPARNFYPAIIDDNPKLDKADYQQSLMELDPVTRAQLMRGDWNIRPDGRMFKPRWFKPISIHDVPPDCTWIRFWDMASTEDAPDKDAKRGGPDFTAGALVGRHHDGRYFIADIRHWRHAPAMNDRLLAATAAYDTPRVAQVMEQEPGSSGKVAIHHYRNTAFVGMNFRGVPSSGSKVIRASPVASQADAGNVYVVMDGTWDVEKFLDEAELFPDPNVHDDQIDALSGAFSALAKAYLGNLQLGESLNSGFMRSNPWRPDVGLVLNPSLLANGTDPLWSRITQARVTDNELKNRVAAAWNV